MNKVLFSLGLTLFAPGSALTQAPISGTGFEVASIKPTDPAFQGTRMGGSPSGGFYAKGATLKILIQQAYDLRDFQISGGPRWIEIERYDITAKGEGLGVTEEELSRMPEEQRNVFKARLLLKLQLLLADRFQLKVHKETKEMPLYGLAVARSGSKLQTALDDGKNAGSISISRSDTGNTDITGRKMSMSSLARFVSSQIGRTVRDQTGLTGEYDFKLSFAQDMVEGADGPSIFTAIQDQLGLRLDSQKGPVEVLIVDSAQRPSEN